jgi:predicted ABC-type ATPase
MPLAVILAGPNGAGKTTFASEYLSMPDEQLIFVNADEIAREAQLLGLPATERDFRAGRLMLRRLGEHVVKHVDFMFETTLASLGYARSIRAWRTQGYHVALIYLRLPDVARSIDRVQRRVAAGGHDIPEAIIRRRFAKSLTNFDRVYRPIVDEWYVWDSLEGGFTLAQSWHDR